MPTKYLVRAELEDGLLYAVFEGLVDAERYDTMRERGINDVLPVEVVKPLHISGDLEAFTRVFGWEIKTGEVVQVFFSEIELLREAVVAGEDQVPLFEGRVDMSGKEEV